MAKWYEEIPEGFDYNKANAEIAAQEGRAIVAPPEQAAQPVQPNANPQVQKKPNSSQIVEDIYSLPQPTYDAKRPEEMRRMARYSAIAQGIGALGDALSLGTGANVNKPTPNQLPTRLYELTQAHEDNYNKRMDDWRTQQALQRIRGMEYKQAREWQEKNYEDQQQWRRDQVARDEANRAQQQDNWDKTFKATEEDRRRRDEESRWYKRETIRQRDENNARMNRSGGNSREEEGYVPLYINGQEIVLGPSQASSLAAEARLWYDSKEYKKAVGISSAVDHTKLKDGSLIQYYLKDKNGARSNPDGTRIEAPKTEAPSTTPAANPTTPTPRQEQHSPKQPKMFGPKSKPQASVKSDASVPGMFRTAAAPEVVDRSADDIKSAYTTKSLVNPAATWRKITRPEVISDPKQREALINEMMLVAKVSREQAIRDIEMANKGKAEAEKKRKENWDRNAPLFNEKIFTSNSNK